MSSRITLRSLSVVVLLLSLISGKGAEAQSVACGPPPLPLLGTPTTPGAEICVKLEETPPLVDPAAPVAGPFYFRAPAVPGAPPIPLPVFTFLEYTVDPMAVDYVSGPTGMAVGLAGTVTKAVTGGNGLLITVNAGWGTALPGASGDLTLAGMTASSSPVQVGGASQVQVGGAAGFPIGTTEAEDLSYKGFGRIINVMNFGYGPFADTILGQNVDPEAVAIQMATSFHLNVSGDTITIPSGVGLAPVGGTPPIPGTAAAGGKPHFECYSVDEHYPQEQYRAVRLADQFAEVKTKIGKITRICTPVDKNGEGIPDPKLHLVCYEILNGHDPNRPVETTNQFGRTTMNVRNAQELCVPSTKKLIERE